MHPIFRMICCLLFISLTPLCAEGEVLEDQLDSDLTFSLKWENTLGITSYKTPIHYHDGKIVVASRGIDPDLLGDTADGVFILDASSGEVLQHLNTQGMTTLDVVGAAVSDDGIFFGNHDNLVLAFDWEGALKWGFKTLSPIDSPPSLADFNQDGSVDVCISTKKGVVLALNGLTGDLLWEFTIFGLEHNDMASFETTPTLYDLTGDGVSDALLGALNGLFYAVNGATGDKLWEYDTRFPSGIRCSAIVKDQKIFFANTESTVFILDTKGELLKKTRLDRNPVGLYASPVFSASDHLFIGSHWPGSSSGVWVVPPYGQLDPVFVDLGQITASGFVADLLGTGTPQLGFITKDGNLFLLDEEGNTLSHFTLPSGSSTTPLVADVDGDGLLELLMTTEDWAIRCYDTKSQGNVYWGNFRGNNLNTGVLDKP